MKVKAKTLIEKIIDAVELEKELKTSGSLIVKKNKQEDWNKEVEESSYNSFFGNDMKCALVMMKAIKRGLDAKDVVHMSEHYYKVPASRTGDLLYKYSEEGEEIYSAIASVQKKALNKKLFYMKKQ